MFVEMKPSIVSGNAAHSSNFKSLCFSYEGASLLFSLSVIVCLFPECIQMHMDKISVDHSRYKVCDGVFCWIIVYFNFQKVISVMNLF